MTAVYRAPMRSRSDAVDARATIERARRLGLCGFGRLVRGPGEQDRLASRVARFAAAADGSFVWTRDADGLFRLGRICGEYRYDDDPAAAAVDLVHVRPCDWLPEPLLEPQVPDAVVATFGRGGRNFQQNHHPSVSQETQRIWDAWERQ
ncbi:GAF domain-containing protein [Mycobacterium sp. 852002-51163_SCH5372311]|uniref:GAF domain-containing protein n=1 Tax=Mycobacterium sp. 852002-51163_SCH5372311 TaxID=1834097 RepID=UPI0009EE779A|nr:GAF domain-containing protein [Mycobacterium sp. 852002-51163_SCH5372311]